MYFNQTLQALDKMTYPLVMLNIELTEKYSMVIVIIKSKIKFPEGRLEGNMEFIGSEFCDSNGSIYILREIILEEKRRNLWQKLFDKTKFKVWGTYNFEKKDLELTLIELKDSAIRLMKFETVEGAHEEYSASIQESESYEAVIGQFGLGIQG